MKSESLTSQAFKGGFWDFGSNIIGRTGALLFTVVIARLLLPEKFGIYTLSMAVALVFITTFDFGINQTLIRYVSNNLHNHKKSSSYYYYILKIKIMVSLSISLVLLLLSYPLAVYVFSKPELFIPLIIASLYVLVFSMEQFFTSKFYIISRVDYSAVKELIMQFFRIILVFPLFYLLSDSLRVSGVVFVMVLSVSSALLFSYYYSRKLLFFDSVNSTSLNYSDRKKVLSFMSFLVIGGLSGVFYSYVDTVMLGIFLDSEFVGLYRASYALAFGIAGLLALHRIFLSVFSKSSNESVSRNFNRILNYLLLIIIPASLGTMALSSPIIISVFGDDYGLSVMSLNILALVMIPAVINNLYTSVFSSKEKPKIFVKALLFSAVLNVVLNYLFITLLMNYSSLWAVSAAAFATLISTIFYFFMLSLMLRKNLSIKTDYSLFIKPLFAGLIMFFLLRFLSNSMVVSSYLKLLLLIPLGLVVYSVVILFLGGINLDDLPLIRKLIRGI